MTVKKISLYLTLFLLPLTCFAAEESTSSLTVSEQEESLLSSVIQMNTVEQLEAELVKININHASLQAELDSTTDSNKKLSIESQIQFLEYATRLIKEIILQIQEINDINDSDDLSKKIQEIKLEYQANAEKFYALSDNPGEQKKVLNQINIIKNIHTLAGTKLESLLKQENVLQQNLSSQLNQQDAIRKQITAMTDAVKLDLYLTAFTKQYEQFKEELENADSMKRLLLEDQMAFLNHIIQLISPMIDQIKSINSLSTKESLDEKIKELEAEYYEHYQAYQNKQNNIEQQKNILDNINVARTLYIFTGSKMSALLEQEKVISEKIALQKIGQDSYREKIFSINNPIILNQQLLLLQQTEERLQPVATSSDPIQKALVLDQLQFIEEIVDIINQKIITIEEQNRILNINNEQEKIAAEQALLEQQLNQGNTKEQLLNLLKSLEDRKNELLQLQSSTTDPAAKELIDSQINFIDDLTERVNQKITDIDAQVKLSADQAYQQELQSLQDEQSIIEEEIKQLNTLYDLNKQKDLFEQKRTLLQQELANSADPYEKLLLQNRLDFIEKMLALMDKKQKTLLERQAIREEIEKLKTPEELLAKLNELKDQYEKLRAEYLATSDPIQKNDIFDELKFIEEIYNLVNSKYALAIQANQLTPEEQEAINKMKNGTYINIQDEYDQINSFQTEEELDNKVRELEEKIEFLNSLKDKVNNPEIIDLYIEQIRNLFDFINNKLKQILQQKAEAALPKPVQQQPPVQPLTQTMYTKPQAPSSPIRIEEILPEVTVSEEVIRSFVPTDETIVMYNVTQTAQEQKFLNQLLYVEKYIADMQAMLTKVRPNTSYSNSLEERIYVLKQYRAYFIQEITHLRDTLPNVYNSYRGPMSTARSIFGR